MFVRILSRLGLILLFSMGLITGHPAVAQVFERISLSLLD